ncbi:uncharacterized protein PRCAT00003718001 [Priceomyces carsonii]|uniref:uncharacterized protein n=1 Tax=Priceomyces carsonii TaxID=28549 RepID=UPI002ED9889F|nr:unnamed protein product [Priceomyces carsonii]
MSGSREGRADNRNEPKKMNPFYSEPKKKTIRRNAKEVYPHKEQLRKGLNIPQYNSNLPLDYLFQEVEKAVNEPMEKINIQTLHTRFLLDNSFNQIDQRYQVVEKLLNILLDIQTLSNESEILQSDKNLVKISLHDIKTFGKVFNLILLIGIQPALEAFKIGIPIEKRMLRGFSSSSIDIHIPKFPLDSIEANKKHEYSEKLLILCQRKLLHLFTVESDVKDLLLRGTGFSDFLTITIALITVPEFDKARSDSLLRDFDDICNLSDTFELYQTYTLLISTASPKYFKEFVMDKLKLLPLRAPRKDGVLTLIEFVLGLREGDEINVEKFDHVANVILLKPKTISSTDYFTNICNQFYNLLVNINKPIVTSCIGYVIEKLYYKNKLIVHDFLFKRIWQNFDPSEGKDVSESQLNNNINVIISLSNEGLPEEISTLLFRPILLPLWSYYSFTKKKSKSNEVVKEILVGYLATVNSALDEDSSLDMISKNLLYENDKWQFEVGANGLIQISSRKFELKSESKDKRINRFLNDLDLQCQYFIELLKNLDDDLIQRLFVHVLKRWLKISREPAQLDMEDNPFMSLIDLRLLETLVKEFEGVLARTPFEILELVKNLLMSFTKNGQNTKSSIIEEVSRIQLDDDSDNAEEEEEEEENDDDDDDEDDEDENLLLVYPTVLELLSAILSDSALLLDQRSSRLLEDILKPLRVLSELLSSQAIRNSANSLFERITLLLKGGDIPATSTRDAHEKILKRAITSLNDPLVPIRAHGLHILRQLVELKSDVISLDFVIELHLIQLKDPEPFIYLNAIKGFDSLIEWNKFEVLDNLLRLYGAQEGELTLDERLRTGEIIQRFTQNENNLLSGDIGSLITSSMLRLIRRSNNDASEVDNTMRMSAMSILGACCRANPLGIVDKLEDSLDCAIGILQLETDQKSSIMRRSAIVLIHDLIIGVSQLKLDIFPPQYREKILTILNYIKETDNDILARDQAETTLKTIGELIQLAMEPENF